MLIRCCGCSSSIHPPCSGQSTAALRPQRVIVYHVSVLCCGRPAQGKPTDPLMAERMDHTTAEYPAAAREAQGSGPARHDLNGGGEPSGAPSRDDQTRSAGRDRPREERSHRHSRDRDRDRDRDRGGRDDDRSRSRRDRERSRERSKKSHRRVTAPPASAAPATCHLLQDCPSFQYMQQQQHSMLLS